jgi:hypothetical protein
MDNNFINIDDLVRQRLSGASEPERSGAWNRMSALLDEEDRRKPLGIYWNRVMNYCGVAMLMAAVSVGGYEMTTAFRTTAEPAAPGSLAKGSLPATGNATRSTTSADLATANGRVAAKHAAPVHNPVVENNHNVAAAGNASAPAVHKGSADKSFHSVAAKGAAAKTSIVNNTPAGTAASTIAGATVVTDNNVTAANDNASSTIKVASATGGNTNLPGAVKKAVNATGNTAMAGKNKATVNPQPSTNNNGNKLANTVASATPAQKKEVVAITEITEKNKKLFAKAPAAAPAVNAKVAKTGKLAGIYVASTVKNNKKAPTRLAKPPVVQPKVVAATQDQAPVKPIEGKKVLERIVLHQTVTGVYGDHVESRLDTISIDEVTIALKQAREKAAAEKAAAEYAAKVAAEEKEAALANVKQGTTAKTNAGKTAGRTAVSPKTNTGATKVAAANATQPEDNVLASASMPAVDAATSAPAIATQPADNAVAPVVPNAAPPASAPPANEKPAAKKGHGINMAEMLSDKFNEIKFKLGNTQFAPGLTAGINGTFFGPNSFRGFQFGFTGAFEVDEHWTFMTELKYFHRVNNNYSMNDYYNKYSAVAGGFEKDSVVQTYSFATLHSFELPLTMRYNAGKCSFFAGGNFVYTLAVNTDQGMAQSVDPNIITKPVVATNTIAATPNIHDADFRARFGIGYIFGLSYRVAPNVTFDLRNVQTFWDNAKDGGSKAVSNQLFKSPSLQFSIQYRLGRGNNEERD